MPENPLRTFVAVPDAHDRERMLETPGWVPDTTVPVERPDGTSVTVDVLDDLMAEWAHRGEHGEWRAAADSDSWLAPRLHAALRLTRVQAADKGVWLWSALRHARYVERRWGSPAAEGRWTGGVNKQALARLWWGAELFRDGDDYTPVDAAFRLQDLPNSFLHREVVRVRPFAVALARFAVAADGAERMTADRLNGIAGVANLVLAGSSPEATTSWWVEDLAPVRAWSTEEPQVPTSWDTLPLGPATARVPHDVTLAAEQFVRECDRLGPDFARAKGNRAGMRAFAAAAILEQAF